MARESTGNVKPRHLLGRGDSFNYFGQTRQISVAYPLSFNRDEMIIDPDEMEDFLATLTHQDYMTLGT